jgi:nicotinate-nucleotide adenylyltransferase
MKRCSRPRSGSSSAGSGTIGLSRQEQRDFLRAAQAFQRIFESYPDDSLAERALFQEGRSYGALWTRPDRDASYGDAALATYSSIGTYYPDSKYKDSVAAQVRILESMFAQKHYDVGMYYLRDKAYDSANLSFERVLENWPDAPRARRSAPSHRVVSGAQLPRGSRRRLRGDPSEVRRRRRRPEGLPAAAGHGREATHRWGYHNAPLIMRIGMLGGSFDPPHVGHLLIAVDAFEALALDKLFFLPAAIQPLKIGQAGASARDRVEMVRRLVGDDPRFGVDTIEVDRAGVSYSVDTVTAYAGRYPEAQRFFLVGADVMPTFGEWREPDRIMRQAEVVVMRRGNEGEGAEQWRTRFRQLTTRRIDVSSTEIRARVRASQSIGGFVPPSVAAYIAEAGLYR